MIGQTNYLLSVKNDLPLKHDIQQYIPELNNSSILLEVLLKASN
jgi:hypothetical protein